MMLTKVARVFTEVYDRFLGKLESTNIEIRRENESHTHFFLLHHIKSLICKRKIENV